MVKEVFEYVRRGNCSQRSFITKFPASEPHPSPVFENIFDSFGIDYRGRLTKSEAGNRCICIAV